MKNPFGRIRNKFLRDAATLQFAGGLNQVSQVASTVLIAYLLGARGQGLYVSAIALQGLVYFLINVGVAQATVSSIAAASARGNEVKIRGWIAFLAKAVLCFGTGILVLGYFVMPTVGHWIFDIYEKGGTGQGRLIGLWAWWLCLQPLLELPRVVAGAAFQGTRRMFALGQIENGQEVVRLFLVVLGATVTGSPAGAIIGHLAACAIGSVVAVDVYRRARHDGQGYLPGVREILSTMRSVPLRRGLRQGLRVGLLKNSHSLFITIFPRLIIGGVVGLDWVAYFHIAQRIMQLPMTLMLGVSRTALPAMSELAGLKDMDRFRRLFVKMSLITGGFITAGIVGAMPFIRPVIGVLFPPDYANPVWQNYWVLSFGYVFLSFATPIESFYIAANQLRSWIWISIVGAICTIPTNVLLVLKIPYVGTAWGLSLYQSWVLVHLGYITYFFATSHRRLTWGPQTDSEGAAVGEAAGDEPAAEAAGGS